MQTFSEQLNTVRREHGITQEQLADKLNVSRTTISRWESGKIIPDLDTIKLLSQVLDFNFFNVSDIDNAQPVGAGLTPGSTSSPSRRKLIVWIAIAVCVVILGGAAAFLLLRNNDASDTANMIVITPMEDPAPLIRSDEFYQGVGWFFGFTFTNTQDTPFTMNQIVQTIITDDGVEVPDTYLADDMESWWDSNILTKDAPRKLIGGQPEQAIKAVRIVLTGTDAKGQELTFESCLTLSREIKED